MNPFTEPKTLYQEANPYGTFTAYLEDDGRTVYLYLQGEQNPEYGIKSVWICNRVAAPEKRNREDLGDGSAPILIQSEVNDPKPHPPMEEKDIYFIWTEEGDGVALFYKETLCAFLPPWSGVDGFHGYSINAKIDALTAYPLGNSEFGTIPDRVQASRDYWETRSQKGAWKEIQEKRLHFLESKLGKHDKYWSADGGKYPQLGIVRFRSEKFPDLLIYSTIGMSAQNMPCVELFHKNYEDYARIELVLSVKIGSEGLERSESWVPHLIGELIRFPWNMAKWLGHGHTISMTRKDPEALYLDFASVLFRDLSSFSAATAPDLSGLISENGKQVRFLTLLPLSEEEKEYAQKDGIQSFNQSWDRKGLPWYHDAERQSLV
ncbi:suppressor of fused domain protein [Leptospira ellisii]|uniref:Suppressor of fused domain protein n=2 Tax=Leptospira ellisii TaxID=2023197 RepID=A0AAE4QKA5_9LEPT|nr:suppressor of fused domain protein [Leptospira ellisii]MDV6234197.1 suppressor of fused domain protein [Leptospira ellisii]